MYEFVLKMSLTSVLAVPSFLALPAFSYVSLLSCVTRLTVAAYACVRGCMFGHQESFLRWWSTTSSSACLSHRATTTVCFLRSTATSGSCHRYSSLHLDLATFGEFTIFPFIGILSEYRVPSRLKMKKQVFLLRRKTSFLYGKNLFLN